MTGTADPKWMLAQSKAGQAGPAPYKPIDISDGLQWSDVTQLILLFILVMGIVGIAVSLYRAHNSKEVRFNLFDLIVGPDGRLVPENCIVMMAFLLHCWALVGWIVRDIVTTADFTAFGAIWVTPLVMKLLRGRQQYPKEIEDQVKKLVEEEIAKAKEAA